VVRVEAEGYEADDVIATLTRRALEEGVDVDILSGDKVTIWFGLNKKPMGFREDASTNPSSDFTPFVVCFHVSPFQSEGPDAVDNPRVSQLFLLDDSRFF
jgi:5'-3' exonuclease